MPLNPIGLPTAELTQATAQSSYEIGYGKPPVHSRFAKGQSGNPNGRAKRIKTLNVIVREQMTQAVTIRSGGRDKKVSRAEALVMKAMEAASKGDLRAIEKLLVRFAAAMPDKVDELDEAIRAEAEPLTATDAATLDALRQMMAADLDKGLAS
ncbi:hypothetical protein C1T17_13470 [Sphingobium sp. SCG-1]|nr:hypothetical protein C1T17_13470 [Sphingobium sp. SCG-1]